MLGPLLSVLQPFFTCFPTRKYSQTSRNSKTLSSPTSRQFF
uniref:Uncharacterized protein n=1 Tax=Arundo donax TaxID=35708 RepID=A0A0A9AUF2_ARUDO